ncbi:hypothetical protein XELAEV_18011370mg, partial [Xenopus laevis]
AAKCKTEPKSRINCGFGGITRAECNNKGCCFDSSIVGTIWCFYPKPEEAAAKCKIEPKSRINCGFGGITRAECNNKGCCFDSSIVGTIWCFYPKPEE